MRVKKPYLRMVMPPGQVEALNALHDAIRRVEDHSPGAVPCIGPHARRWTSEAKHELARAERACPPCPLIHTCADYANTFKESFGVWGGFKRSD